jgi:hypothetical protein
MWYQRSLYSAVPINFGGKMLRVIIIVNGFGNLRTSAETFLCS